MNMALVWNYIMEYWYFVPTAMTVAGYLARYTKNEVDNKIVAFVMKIVDLVALHPDITKLRVLDVKFEK